METYVHLREELQDSNFALRNLSSPSDCAKVMSSLAEDLVHSIRQEMFVSKGSVMAADPALLAVSKPFLPNAHAPTHSPSPRALSCHPAPRSDRS